MLERQAAARENAINISKKADAPAFARASSAFARSGTAQLVCAQGDRPVSAESHFAALACPGCDGSAAICPEYRRFAAHLESTQAAQIGRAEGMVQMCPHCGEILVFELAAPAKGVEKDRVRKITDEELACIPLWLLTQMGRQQDQIRAQRRAARARMN